VINRKKRERERKVITLTTSLERQLRYPISASWSLETKRCHQSSRDSSLLDYYFLPISLVSLISNETTSKCKVHSKERAKITYNVAKNALINENQICNLITLNAKLNVTKILDTFSTKTYTPPTYQLSKLRKRNKQTNKHAQEKKKKRRGTNNCRASRARGP